MTTKMYVEPLVEPYKNPFIFTGNSINECYSQCQDLLNVFHLLDDEKNFHVYRCDVVNDAGQVFKIQAPNKDTDIFDKYDKLKDL